MRAFLAIVPPANFTQKVQGLLQELAVYHTPHLRCTQAHKMHITLHFFSELAEEHIKPLIFTINNILKNFDSIPIHITKKLLLPSNSTAKILSYQIKPSKELTQLKMLLDGALLSFGYKTNHEKFLPHITLSRSKNSELLQKLDLPNADFTFYTKEIILFESKPEQGEFNYRVVEIITAD